MNAGPSNRAWAIFFARWILGLIFFLAGVWKVFELGSLEHARQMFVEPFADSFLPAWLLWLSGTTIPWVELLGGGLLIVGLFRREALVALGTVLVVVTFGHLLEQPLYAFDSHVIPRLSLLLFLLLMPANEDSLSLDCWWARRRARESG